MAARSNSSMSNAISSETSATVPLYLLLITGFDFGSPPRSSLRVDATAS